MLSNGFLEQDKDQGENSRGETVYSRYEDVYDLWECLKVWYEWN